MNKVVYWLLNSAEPSVRFKVMTRVLDYDLETAEVEQIRQEVKTSPRTQALLSERGPDGKIPHRPYAKWIGAHWFLTNLANIGYPPGDESLAPKAFKLLSFLLFMLVFWGCNATEEPAQTNIFPEAGAISGWTPVDEERTFDSENLFDLVNGQAESFFVLGFEQVQVQDYENTAGIRLGVEVWQLASPADAYGVFSTAIVGDPVAIGNDGDSSPGRRLAFWQDRYFAHIRARQVVDDTDLQAFAQAVSAALPAGGEKPELVAHMPTDGLIDRTPIYFHQDLTLQNYLWLGGDNPLNLSQATNAVLGHYEIDGEMAQLLLVQYPDAEVAARALAALQRAGIEDLVLADSQDGLLRAVFGEVSPETAQTLLASTL